MKKIVAGFLIVVWALAFPSSVGAQQREGGYRGERGRGTGQSRSYRGRQQRRRYYGGRYEWYEDPAGAAGAAAAGWLWRQFTQPQQEQATRPDREPVRDIAWCIKRYTSYNPRTQQYLGYDGKYHDCP